MTEVYGGLLSAYDSKKEFNLERQFISRALFVRPDYRGLGIAQELLKVRSVTKPFFFKLKIKCYLFKSALFKRQNWKRLSPKTTALLHFLVLLMERRSGTIVILFSSTALCSFRKYLIVYTTRYIK